MSGSHSHRHDATSADPSGEPLHPQHRDAHCRQHPGSSAPLEVKKAVEDWPGAARGGQQAGSTEDRPGVASQGQQQAGSVDDGSSEDYCSKEKLDERMSLNSSSDSGVRSPLCRICFQGPDQGELISPCRCSGSVRCTHEPCLIKWISERGSWSCELCYYKYHVVNISTKNPLQWQTISLTNIEKVQIAAAVLGSLFLLASVSWLVWSSVSPHARWQRQDLFFQICYAMYGFMDWVCIVMIVHEGPSVFRIFHRWQAVNKRRKVLNYNKARDLEEQEMGPDSSPREHPYLPEPNPRMGGLSGGRLVSELPSPSTSSLLVAVAVAEAAATGQVTVWDREEEADSRTSTTLTAMSESEPSSHSNTGQSLSSVFEQNHSYRWTYSLLHVLGQQSPFLEQQNPEPQGLFHSPAQTQPRDSNRELVMRVTTV